MNGFIMIALALLLGVDKLVTGEASGWLRTIAAVVLLLAGLAEAVSWLIHKDWRAWQRKPAR